MIPADLPDTYWAMPDNGFGNKANSRSFMLRAYRVKPDFKTALCGTGTVEIQPVYPAEIEQ